MIWAGIFIGILIGIAIIITLAYFMDKSSKKNQNARKFLESLKPGDSVTFLDKYRDKTKKGTVVHNMPSLQKIEIGNGSIISDIYSYAN